MHFNRSKESNPSVKKSDLIVRMTASVLKNPAAIAGIGPKFRSQEPSGHSRNRYRPLDIRRVRTMES